MQKVSMNHVVNQLLEDWLADNGAMQKQPSTFNTSTKRTASKGKGEKDD